MRMKHTGNLCTLPTHLLNCQILDTLDLTMIFDLCLLVPTGTYLSSKKVGSSFKVVQCLLPASLTI